jgi:hypothetical protein
MNSGRLRALPRRHIRALRRALYLLCTELARLNAVGAGQIEHPVTRRQRSSVFRALMAEKYRDRSTCC